MTVRPSMTEGLDSSEKRSKAGRDNNALTIIIEILSELTED